jgi:hypothetical protein
LDIPYGFAAMTYNAVGDTKMAVRYARLAEEAVLMKDGEIVKDPKKHWSYRRHRTGDHR